VSTIRFHPLGISAEARGETILEVAQRVGVPIATSCGGIGICTRCRITVLEGKEQLSERTMIERDQGRLNNFAENERLACQSCVEGDCTITTSYW